MPRRSGITSTSCRSICCPGRCSRRRSWWREGACSAAEGRPSGRASGASCSPGSARRSSSSRSPGASAASICCPAFPAAALLCADAVFSALRAGARPPRWDRDAARRSRPRRCCSPDSRFPRWHRILESPCRSPSPRSGWRSPAPRLLAFRAAGRSWLRRSVVVVASVAFAEAARSSRCCCRRSIRRNRRARSPKPQPPGRRPRQKSASPAVPWSERSPTTGGVARPRSRRRRRSCASWPAAGA